MDLTPIYGTLVVSRRRTGFSFLGLVLLAGQVSAGPAESLLLPVSDASPASIPGRHLTEAEARLWVEQGVDTPAPHLRSLSAARQAGGVTMVNLVAVLVDFPDLAADRTAHPPEYYRHLLFSREDDGFRSVAEYLDASSRGRLRLDGTVRGWFTVSKKRNDYTMGAAGIGYYPANSQRLAEEAFYLADPTVNFASFDNEGPDGVSDSGDDDEIVDGIVIIHALPQGGGGTLNDFESVFWWTPDEFPMDGVFGRFFTLNPEDGNIGIFLHELGHLFGLPDLYDTTGRSFGMGLWSMMAGGHTLDGGRQPADFDAWCKSQLGFVNVLQVQQNMKDVRLEPSIVTGSVYRLWRPEGSTSEYFLLENRQATGLDSGLPAGGLFVYHVDDKVATNNLPNHYKVAVEQADGLFQLENRFNDRSFGDPGDPFQEGDVFGRYSVPNSMDYDGTDTYVHVYNLRGPDAGGAIVTDLSVEPGPLVEVVDLAILELEGNGDGLVTAGELAGLVPRIAVSRRAAQGLVLHARSLDPRGTLLDPDLVYGTVPAGTIAVLPQPMRVAIDPDLPSDPYGLRMEFSLEWQDAPGRQVPVEIGLGTRVGREDDFEVADHGWTHGPVRPTAFDQWNYGPNFGANQTAGFRHGFYSGGYLRGVDAELLSPPVLLPPGAALVFQQSVDIATPDSTRAQAGGAVEVSVNGGDWQPAVPDGGYPATIGGSSLEWQGRGVYSGRIQNGNFHTVRVDLSRYSGSIRVRFRFFSDAESRLGTGWGIDNVRILSDATPVRVLRSEARVAGEGVELAWELADPLPSRIRWLRGPDPEHAAWTEEWTEPTPSGTTLDPEGARHLPADYWLLGLERNGTVSRWGPWKVTGTVSRPAFAWNLLANPTRGEVQFGFEGDLDPGAVLLIYDVAGRLVFHGPAGGQPGLLSWSGTNASGCKVSPGVYLARITGAAAPILRVVILP